MAKLFNQRDSSFIMKMTAYHLTSKWVGATGPKAEAIFGYKQAHFWPYASHDFFCFLYKPYIPGLWWPIIVLSFLFNSNIRAEEGNGWYVGPQEQHPLSSWHLALKPKEYASAPSFTIMSTLSNTLNFSEDNHHVDMESVMTELSFAYPLSSSFTLTTDIPVISRSKGYFDGFIRKWHDFFSLPQGARRVVPDDSYHYEVSPKHEQGVDNRLSLGGSGTSLGVTGVGGTWKWREEEHSLLYSNMRLGLPSPDQSFGQQLMDMQLELSWQGAINSLKFTGSTFLTYRSDQSQLGTYLPTPEKNSSTPPLTEGYLPMVRFEPWRYGAYFLMSLPIIESVSARFGLLGASAETSNLPFWGQASAYLDCGVSYSPLENHHLYFLIREDILNRRRSTDFSATLAWAYSSGN